MRCQVLQRSIYVDPEHRLWRIARGAAVLDLIALLERDDVRAELPPPSHQPDRLVSGDLKAPRQRRFRVSAGVPAAPGACQCLLHSFFSVVRAAQNPKRLGTTALANQRPVPILGVRVHLTPAWAR